MGKAVAHFLGLLFGILLAFAGDSAWAQIADINAAINKAGRQRMLSQRLAKAYLQMGQGIEAERSKKILDASVALFDRQLAELKAYAPTAEIKATYQDLERAWLAYREALRGEKPSPEGARKVLAMSEDVLALAHQGTVQLEKHSGSNQGRLVNLAGRQRMLSQRLAKFYQALRWSVAPEAGAAELDQARKEFVAGLEELAAAPNNTQAIRDELELGRQQWIFFENALLNRSAGKRAVTDVATTSERILEVMDSVTGMYEKLGK